MQIMATSKNASVACRALSLKRERRQTEQHGRTRTMCISPWSSPTRPRPPLPTLRHRSDSRIQSRSYPWQSRLYAEFGRSAISPGRRIDSPECQINRKSREGREIGRINASWRLPTSSDEPDIGIAGSGLFVSVGEYGDDALRVVDTGSVCLVLGL